MAIDKAHKQSLRYYHLWSRLAGDACCQVVLLALSASLTHRIRPASHRRRLTSDLAPHGVWRDLAPH